MSSTSGTAMSRYLNMLPSQTDYLALCDGTETGLKHVYKRVALTYARPEFRRITVIYASSPQITLKSLVENATRTTLAFQN